MLALNTAVLAVGLLESLREHELAADLVLLRVERPAELLGVDS
jgi:hypothetical protein